MITKDLANTLDFLTDANTDIENIRKYLRLRTFINFSLIDWCKASTTSFYSLHIMHSEDTAMANWNPGDQDYAVGLDVVYKVEAAADAAPKESEERQELVNRNSCIDDSLSRMTNIQEGHKWWEGLLEPPD